VAYYRNLARGYHNLSAQVTRTVTSSTEQFQVQAQQDMQNFQIALSTENMQGIGNAQFFLQQFSQDQLLLSSAQLPSDYATISANARLSLQALSLRASTYTQLTDFHNTLIRMGNAHLDITAMQSQYDNDVQLFNSATRADDFQNLDSQIDVQYQQIVVTSVQAFPYVSITKLNELETQIHLLQTYGVESTQYQQRLNADQLAVKNVKTVYDELGFFKQVDGDIASLHDDLVRGNARFLVKRFHSEVDTWAKAHPYQDARDGRVYALDNGYMNAGIGAGLDSDLASSDTTAGFESVIAETNNALFNLHLFERDYNDQTPYNQVHATDQQMLDHYHLAKKQVLVVSLVEQAMRVYQNGVLVNSYHVTTGRQELPSLPGVWSVLDRKSPIIFTAAEPKGSPYWFPDTPINYAILYHYGGYFVHDAPWRADFGPGTQFPHEDASGTTAYNFDGSHGCVNLQESDAGWVYAHTDWNTSIVIY
jgi:lipoprotein-anchoring transpeptidase ErfK/SrfK